jgi:hypothetical protein
VYKAFYPEDYDFSKFGAIGGSTASEFDPEYFFKNIMAPEGTNAQTTPTVEEQIISPDDAMNQYDIETPETDFSLVLLMINIVKKEQMLMQIHLVNLIMIYVLMKLLDNLFKIQLQVLWVTIN